MLNKQIIAASFAFVAGIASADVQSSFCVGEKDYNCPVKPVYSCGENADERAKLICTVKSVNGPRVLDYLLVMRSTTEGNKCGYTIFDVTCLTGSSK